MTINTNELRNDSKTAHYGHLPLEVSGSEMLELLDRLEAAEKERDWHAERCEDAMNECDALRAKITEMERQSPICRIKDIRRAHYMTKVVGLDPEAWLYALPGAKGEDK